MNQLRYAEEASLGFETALPVESGVPAALPGPAALEGEKRAERRAEERVLIARCQAGEKEAFAELVARYEERVRWVCFSLVGDREEARDLTQEAWLRTFRNIGRFRLNYSFYTWLYRIVVNLCIDHLRRRGKRAALALEEAPSEPLSQGGPPEEAAEHAETGERIRAVLAQLPPKYRAVLVMRDIHALPGLEIAKIIGCTHATMRWRLHRARDLFRQAWERPVPAR